MTTITPDRTHIRRHRRPAWYRRLWRWLTGAAPRPEYWPVAMLPTSERSPMFAPERTMEEIARDGEAAEEARAAELLAIELAKLSALERWLAASESATLRAEALADQMWLAGVTARATDGAERSADAIARLIGYAGGVAEIRAAELIEACHGDRTELVEHVNEAVPWDMEAELAAAPDLSDEALSAIVSEWSSEVSA